LLKEALVRGLLFKEVLGPRNADLLLGRSAGVEMGPGHLISEISVESHHRKPTTLLERSFPVDADLAILPPRPDVRRHIARRGLPLLG
jgi:hypothetical protein